VRWILCRQEPINSGEEADITVEERKRAVAQESVEVEVMLV
tara:strand:- start:446 stop:568 length:123 start_codon:yes stop_codon:yes gene_type:complete